MFLPKQHLKKLKSLHEDFHFHESTTDLNRGRISGGVAILWHKKYDQLVNAIKPNVNWAIEIEINSVLFLMCIHTVPLY